ncbi:MAG: hypothetical protein AAGA54_00910 [Myxococcota bacterium]
MKARWVARAGVFALVGLWREDASASHCAGCTEPLPVAMEVAPSVVGPSGPLAVTMTPEFPSKDHPIDPIHWETVAVEIRNSEGMVLPGSVHAVDGFSPRLWYPAAAMPPGSYTVTTSVTPTDEHCSPWDEAFDVEVVQDLELPPVPDVVVATEPHSRALSDFTNYVCCEGGRPYRPSEPGTGCFPSTPLPSWNSFCAPQNNSHWLRVNASVDAATEGFFTLREVTTSVRPQRGNTALDLDLHAPDCLEFELLNLYTQDSSLTRWCPDADAKLGVLPIEGAEEDVMTRCGCTAYVCEDEFPDSCRRWPDGGPIGSNCPSETDTEFDEPDTDTDATGPGATDASGCACSQRPTPRGGLPLMLVAVALGIARRRKPSDTRAAKLQRVSR